MKLFFILIPLFITNSLCSMSTNSKPIPMEVEEYVLLHTGEIVFKQSFKRLWCNMLLAVTHDDYSQDVQRSLFKLCKKGKELPSRHKEILKKYKLPTSTAEIDGHTRSIILAACVRKQLLVDPLDLQNQKSHFPLYQEDKP